MKKESTIVRRLTAVLAADIAGYSRLMGEDDVATVRDLKSHQAVVLPMVEEHGGRIIDIAGDGILAEFPSVVGALECAHAIQMIMADRNRDVPSDRQMLFRVGINIGDVLHDGDRIYGDGINIAARLEGLAEPGGICISRQVYDQVNVLVDLTFELMGSVKLKNIVQPVEVYRVIFLSSGSGIRSELGSGRELQQEIRFCTSYDGVQLAYSVIGNGPPVVKTGNWMTHLEYDLESPIWRHLYRELAKDWAIIRYDARGNGLSDRSPEDISYNALVKDLETVIEATGMDKFVLFGISQGCAISIRYAVENPHRVSHLILYGGFVRGTNHRDPTSAKAREALLTLVRLGWGSENPAFRQIFTSQFVPEGTKEQENWFNELQRMTVSPEIAARILEETARFDVTELAPEVRVPTLVMHVRDDARVPFQAGREMAALIPNARFVTLPGRNHLFLEDEHAFSQFLQHFRNFLAG